MEKCTYLWWENIIKHYIFKITQFFNKNKFKLLEKFDLFFERNENFFPLKFCTLRLCNPDEITGNWEATIKSSFDFLPCPRNFWVEVSKLGFWGFIEMIQQIPYYAYKIS